MTIFSKIIAGEIPSYKIAEDEKFMAFLDVFPLVKGHVLVVPKIEVDKLGIDICITSTQKALALPPGLAIASISRLSSALASSLNDWLLTFIAISFC